MNQKGFTLVELSIVLVIIGLLIGGILVGQSLIDSAKLNRQVQLFQQYAVAHTSFKNKFKCHPSDCLNLNTGSVVSTVGDGYVFNNYLPWAYFWGEQQQYFIQLSRLGYVKDLKPNGVERNGTMGIDFPQNPYGTAKSGFVPISIPKNPNSSYFSNPALSELKPGVYLWMNIDRDFTTSLTFENASGRPFIVEEAIALEKKLDDGFPKTGDLLAPAFIFNGHAFGTGYGPSWTNNGACTNGYGGTIYKRAYTSSNNYEGTHICFLVYRLTDNGGSPTN